MLKVKNIDFYYGEIQVLRDVSLEANEGEFVAICGPNGHGKSTLLKVICGVLTPASGSVEYEGKTISGYSTEKIVNMGVVYIPEDRHLFPEMTILDNLKMGAYCKNARLKEMENLDYVFQLFPQLKLLNKQLASSLSGGEGRMLAIGRGLMSNPRFLAVDEPSLGLAPKLVSEVFQAINEIREKGATVLIVEQNTAAISRFADRIYVMEDGRITFGGSRDQALSDEHIREVFLGL